MKRVQRKRAKGWRKPPNTVDVTRASRWGNPFKYSGDQVFCDAAHRRTFLSRWVLAQDAHFPDPTEGVKESVRLYRLWIEGNLPEGYYDNHHIVRPVKFTIEDIKKELKGKDLMCYCAGENPCHADVLLELANQ